MNIDWIAIEGLEEAELLERLGLEPVGASTHELFRKRACVRLPSGWLVMVAKDQDFKVDEALARLSSPRLAVACSVYETVMVSQIKAVRDGRVLWSAAHDPEKDRTSLEVEGDAPPLLENIRQRLESRQAEEEDGVDPMFDAAAELGEALCGYRAGETGNLAWTLLRPAGSGGGSAQYVETLEAMRAELIPLLASLGWTFETEPPDLITPWKIMRRPADTRQSLFFEFTIDPQPWIGVTLRIDETVSADAGRALRLETRPPVVKESFWTRLTGRGRAKPPADPLAAALDSAKADIAAMEDYLRTGQTPDRLRLETWRYEYRPLEA